MSRRSRDRLARILRSPRCDLAEAALLCCAEVEANALWTLELTCLLPDSGADDVEAQGQLLVQFGRYREAADMIHAYLGSSVVGDDEAAGLARLSRRARAQLN